MYFIDAISKIYNMDISKFFFERGVILTKDALEYILSQEHPDEYSKIVLDKNKGKKFLKLEDVKAEHPKFEEQKAEVFIPSDFKPVARDVDPKVKIFDEFDVTGKSESSGSVNDFIDFFRDRFMRISSFLRERPGPTYKDIKSLLRLRPQEVARTIGMVVDKRISRSGHYLIYVEDLTGELTVLIPKDNERLMAKASQLLRDEVIAIDGRFSRGDLFIASDVVQPDIPARKPRIADEDIAVAMISDLHVGSNLFLEKYFRKFLDWIKGNGPRKELAGKIKYITIAGDLVDGIGVYPGQENELDITDIYQQYEYFEDLILEIPDYIDIVIIPGNHDAVRVAAPQPALPKELVPQIFDLDNVHLLGSPSYVSLHGVEFLLYHGQSIHSFVPHIPGFDYSKPEQLGVEALKRRELHVVYGEKPPITPEKRDYFTIERIPDVMHFGDVHKNGYASYKGVTIINSGTWQDITPYQIKQGHHPTPCLLPVMTLVNRRTSLLRFRRGGYGT